MRPDGVLVRIRPDGSEEAMAIPPPQPMNPEQVEEAGRADPDARPFTPAELATVKRIPRIRTLRRALGLTQEEFAARYRIPLGTLRDWEQGRSEPDRSAKVLLAAIPADPDGVAADPPTPAE